MNSTYAIRNFFVLSLMVIVMGGCTYSESPAPLDIIKGNEDIRQEYYKSILKNPTQIQGTVTNKTTGEPLAKVKVTARLENTATKYSTLSKDDGTFSLYVERSSTYIIYGEKVGFDKNYYSQMSQGIIDSTFYITSDATFNIAVAVHDPTPTFKVNYLASTTGYNSYDLSFNGTNLNGLDNYYSLIYYFDSNGKYLKNTPFLYGMSFFACQGSDAYWAGTSSGSKLNKIDPKTGVLLSSVSCQISNPNLVDVEVFNSNFWLLGKASLYKLSMTGELLNTLDLTKIIVELDVRGIVQKNNYLYILNYSTTNANYVLYKIDPNTLAIVTKGYLPLVTEMNNSMLRGLAFDKNNFWTINRYNDLLIKFNTVE